MPSGAPGKISALVVLIAAASCSSNSAKSVDAAVTSTAGDAGDTGGDVGQTLDVAAEVLVDAAIVPPDTITFPEAPEATCHGDATDCPLPPSACADPSCDGGTCPGLQWVIYYDIPTCVNDKCAYEKRYFECTVSTVCSAGGCRFNGTLGASQ